MSSILFRHICLITFFSVVTDLNFSSVLRNVCKHKKWQAGFFVVFEFLIKNLGNRYDKRAHKTPVWAETSPSPVNSTACPTHQHTCQHTACHCLTLVVCAEASTTGEHSPGECLACLSECKQCADQSIPLWLGRVGGWWGGGCVSCL